MDGDIFSCPTTVEVQRQEILRLIRINEERSIEIIKLKNDLYRATMDYELLKKEYDAKTRKK